MLADVDEYIEYLTALTKSADPLRREYALDELTRVATVDLEKVGPKGYIHGWIYVGPQAAGARVFHHEHGHGTVTRHGKRTVGVRFDSGKHHAFEHTPKTGRAGDQSGHFAERVHRRTGKPVAPTASGAKPPDSATPEASKPAEPAGAADAHAGVQGRDSKPTAGLMDHAAAAQFLGHIAEHEMTDDDPNRPAVRRIVDQVSAGTMSPAEAKDALTRLYDDAPHSSLEDVKRARTLRLAADGLITRVNRDDRNIMQIRADVRINRDRAKANLDGLPREHFTGAPGVVPRRPEAETSNATLLGKPTATPRAPDAPKPEQIRGADTKAADLRDGEYASLTGIDQYGQKITFEGFVSNPMRVRVKSPGSRRKEDMLSFQVTENPGGWNGSRAQVLVHPDARTGELHRHKPKTRGDSGVNPGHPGHEEVADGLTNAELARMGSFGGRHVSPEAARAAVEAGLATPNGDLTPEGRRLLGMYQDRSRWHGIPGGPRRSPEPVVPEAKPKPAKPEPAAPTTAHEHERAAEERDLAANAVNAKKRALEQKPMPTKADFNRRVKETRALDERILAHRAAARQHRKTAAALRAQGTTPEDRATLSELAEMAHQAKVEGRHGDAARAYAKRAERLRSGESGWTLTNNAGTWALTGGKDSGAHQTFRSRKAAEEWRTDANKQTAEIAEYEAANQANLARLGPLNERQADALEVARKRSGNPYLQLPALEALTAEDWASLHEERRAKILEGLERFEQRRDAESVSRARALRTRLTQQPTKPPSPPSASGESAAFTAHAEQVGRGAPAGSSHAVRDYAQMRSDMADDTRALAREHGGTASIASEAKVGDRLLVPYARGNSGLGHRERTVEEVKRNGMVLTHQGEGLLADTPVVRMPTPQVTSNRPVPALPPQPKPKAPRAVKPRAPKPYKEPENLEPGARVTWTHHYGTSGTQERTGRVWDLAPTEGNRQAAWVIPDVKEPTDPYSAIAVRRGRRGRGGDPNSLHSSNDRLTTTGSLTHAAARAAQRHRAAGKSVTMENLSLILAAATVEWCRSRMLAKVAA